MSSFFHYNVGHQNFEIITLSEEFERKIVTVYLELIEFDLLYSYHVSAIPRLISHMLIGSRVVRFKVSYNVHYNVSVLAIVTSPCGKSNVTMFTELYYGVLNL